MLKSGRGPPKIPPYALAPSRQTITKYGTSLNFTGSHLTNSIDAHCAVWMGENHSMIPILKKQTIEHGGEVQRPAHVFTFF